MEQYEFYNKLVLRIPRYTREMIDLDLQHLLNDTAYRDALYLASDTVYDQLKKNGFELAKCDEKLLRTLKKYHRRMCFRPTPFGGFASVAVAAWGSQATALKVDPCSFQTLVIQPAATPNEAREDCYLVNPSLYAFGRNLRIYHSTNPTNQGARKFHLDEIDRAGLPSELLAYKRGINQSQLITLLQSYDLTGQEAGAYISELVSTQVLLEAEQPDGLIIGQLPGKNCRDKAGSNYYSSTRNDVTGSLNINLQKELLEALSCLNKLSPILPNPALERFRKRFSELFDRREVPLLFAVDPESGIDYTGCKDVSAGTNAGKSNLPWCTVHELLMRKWTMHQGAGLPVISLNDDDIRALPESDSKVPGQMVMFSMADNWIHIHGAGGVSAITMIGRFTVFDEDVASMARDLAAMEQQSNPDVIFAEIIHENDERTDNVNLRTAFRDYLIPVLTPCSENSDTRIELNDLFLSLVNGAFVLRSKRLNKRIIPRLSSAYNYNRSTLSVFRLLCDLQYEEVCTNAGFSMSALFPGLPFYPRVTYKKAILETASWHLDTRIFKHLEGAGNLQGDFDDLALKLQLPERFIYEQGDQRLLIRRDHVSDLQLLLSVIRGKKRIVLREYLPESSPLVQSDQGSFAHEVVAFLTNREPVYCGLQELRRDSNQQAKFGPLDQWHYLKIYLHPCSADELLLEISRYASRWRKQKLIERWFFVRYADTDDHLRVRFKASRMNGTEFLNELQRLLKKLNGKPNIRTVQLATYKREVERYAAIGIDTAEKLFHQSTRLALETIRNGQEKTLVAGIAHVYAVFLNTGSDHSSMLGLTQGASEALFERLKISKEQKVRYDQEYRTLADNLDALLGKIEPDDWHSYLHHVAKALRRVKVPERPRLILDLNHMHLNRIFNIDALQNEAKCYYFLYKYLLKETFRHPQVFGR